jgi:nucleotide-binding universal stress UspA family protein
MKILLAIDDSKFAEAVLQAAILQVRQDHSQVLVLHVVDWNNFMPTPFPKMGEQPMYSAHQLESIIENETRKAHVLVKDAGDRLRLAGFDVSTSVREGDVKT